MEEDKIQPETEASEDAGPKTPDLVISDLQQQLAAMTEKADDHWQKALRAASDLDNMRKRSERDVAQAHKFGVEKLVVELLPILDSLEQAISAATEPGPEAGKDVVTGVELTLKMFTAALAKFGVTVLNPLDEKFDPNCHEAMTMQPHTEKPSGIVLDVLQKGYCLSERVIRPARVVVVK